jgi:hypothetical protein
MPKVAELPGRLHVCQFHNDHDPPHFHVRQAGRDTLICIADLLILRGALAATHLRAVREWALAHQAELALNWVLARAGLDIRDIPYP